MKTLQYSKELTFITWNRTLARLYALCLWDWSCWLLAGVVLQEENYVQRGSSAFFN